MTTGPARALRRRLGQFLDGFSACVSRQPQRDAATPYIDGLFNDSERKSMQAMHGRVGDPRAYQALPHFITHSPWDAARVWTPLRTVVPIRAVNSVVLIIRPFDPYPFIFLNLVLSCLAAVQAPVIMMSQIRQEARDRLHAMHDYQVNLKAELEIRHLHQKLDHLLSHQWERLVEIQEIQMELINEKRGRS